MQWRAPPSSRCARVARLSNAEAQIVRLLFRLAETRRDGELYALVARRIDAYGGTRRPFGPQTRQYLRRRVARVLRRLGRAASADYVAMASAILLGYDDEDAVGVKTRPVPSHLRSVRAVPRVQPDPLHRTRRATRKPTTRHSFWSHAAGLSPRRRRRRTPARKRYPELWDRAPNALWDLILKSGTTPVIEFATRALRANAAFTNTLRDEQLAVVLATGHPLAQRFAYDIARGRPMSIVLARGALACDVPDAHAWVVGWIETHADETVADPDLLALHHHRQDGGDPRSRTPDRPQAAPSPMPVAEAAAAFARDPARPLGYAGERRARFRRGRRRSCAFSRPRCATSAPRSCATW